MPNIPIITFNSGELSPKLDARADIAKYGSGCRKLENMIPLIYGPAERRPGFEYIYDQYDSETASRVIPFIYSNEIAYAIEMDDRIFRFFFDGGIVVDDEVVTTVTPYLETDLLQIQYAQSIDVMWLVHENYAPRQLNRISASEFELKEIEFTYGPFFGRNDYIKNDEITLSSSVILKDAAGTLTAAGPMSPVPVFESGHVGSLWKLVLPRATTGTNGTATGTGTIGSAIDIEGSFHMETTGHWAATVELQRNQDGNGWEIYRSWISTLATGVGSLNVDFTDIEYAQNTQYRIYVSSFSGGTVEAFLTVNSSTQAGIVKIQSVEGTDSATIKVITPLASTDATKQWYEGSWSGVRGYPKTVTFYQDRCIYAGTDYQPQTIWLSKSGDYNRIGG